jgi:hypothetical protein
MFRSAPKEVKKRSIEKKENTDNNDEEFFID